MANFSKVGVVYGILWSLGKPPQELDLGLSGWAIDLYKTEQGRKLGITNLKKLDVQMINTFELKLKDILRISRQNIYINSEKRFKDFPIL